MQKISTNEMIDKIISLIEKKIKIKNYHLNKIKILMPLPLHKVSEIIKKHSELEKDLSSSSLR